MQLAHYECQDTKIFGTKVMGGSLDFNLQQCVVWSEGDSWQVYQFKWNLENLASQGFPCIVVITKGYSPPPFPQVFMDEWLTDYRAKLMKKCKTLQKVGNIWTLHVFLCVLFSEINNFF